MRVERRVWKWEECGVFVGETGKDETDRYMG